MLIREFQKADKVLRKLEYKQTKAELICSYFCAPHTCIAHVASAWFIRTGL